MTDLQGDPIASAAARAPSWRGWVGESVRSLVFLRPRWDLVRVAPLSLLVLVAFGLGLRLVVEHAWTEGPALFNWRAVAGGWVTVVLGLWVSWLAVRLAPPGSEPGRPGVAELFGVLAGQSLFLQILTSLAWLCLRPYFGALSPELASRSVWTLWGLSVVWTMLAGVWLLGAQARHRVGWLAALAVLGVSQALRIWAPDPNFWYPDREAAIREAAVEEHEPEFITLTQEVMEAQSGVLIDALEALQPQRRGLVDLYAITFAPYADEDVFSREATLVSDVMRQRFDAQGRVLQLQNHPKTAERFPWATPLNLRRAIERAAQRMDRDEDILFIHLTSHGAQDGQLSARFWPLEVDELTPQQLRAWLDDAGIRFRVISVSACYSGSWVAPLSAPGTLVMTAADAEHTSYGCGRKSQLTFFGRAMYDEQLRETHSFEHAHAVARAVIDRREKESGKTDGYSNPQIYVGAEIRTQLSRLEARLAQMPAAAPARRGASAPAQ